MDDTLMKIGREAGLRGLPEEAAAVRAGNTGNARNADAGNAGAGNAVGNKWGSKHWKISMGAPSY